MIALTDASGNVVEKYAYDPWGARRNPDDWTQKDSRTKWIINRGYTGHEHIDAFGIINMNGLVYDPLTAMFMSPDPFVQSPDNWVNYNRYGYCLNNPLIYTDPSGYKNWQSAGYWTPQIDPYQMWDYLQGVRDGAWGGYGSGGGFGGGIPTPMGHSSDIWDEADKLWYSPNGGYTNGETTIYFKSYEEEYFAGSIYKLLNDRTFTMRFVFDPKNMKQSNNKIKSNKQLENFVNDNFEERLPNNDLTWMFWDNDWGETVPLDRSNKTSPLTVYIPSAFGDYLDLLYLCIDHELVHVNDWASGRIERSLSMYNADNALAITEYRAYSRSIWTSNTLFNGKYDFSASYRNAINGLPSGYKLINFTYY